LAQREKILIVRLSALGDVIHTLPVLPAIRSAKPQAFIGWVVGAAAAPLVQGHPALDACHVLESNTLKGWLKLVLDIRRQGYTLAIDTQGLLKSALLPVLCGIPNRVGFSDSREGSPWLYTSRVQAASRKDHSVSVLSRYWQLIEAVGVDEPETADYTMGLAVRDNWPEFKALQQQLFSDNTKPVVAIALHTAWASKNWPITHWQSLIEMLLSQTQAQVVILNDNQPKHHDDYNFLLNTFRGYGDRFQLLRFGLPNLVDFLARCRLILGGDSFVVHLAAALQRPFVVALYGPTSALRTPPPLHPQFSQTLMLPEKLPCQPCHNKSCQIQSHDCLLGLLPEAVFSAIQPRLV
jgi:heptosyltransferase I